MHPAAELPPPKRSWTEYRPVQKSYVEYVPTTRVEYVPVRRFYTDYKPVRHEIDYKPVRRYETAYEFVPKTKEFVSYLPQETVREEPEDCRPPAYGGFRDYQPGLQSGPYIAYYRGWP